MKDKHTTLQADCIQNMHILFKVSALSWKYLETVSNSIKMETKSFYFLSSVIIKFKALLGEIIKHVLLQIPANEV